MSSSQKKDESEDSSETNSYVPSANKTALQLSLGDQGFPSKISVLITIDFAPSGTPNIQISTSPSTVPLTISPVASSQKSSSLETHCSDFKILEKRIINVEEQLEEISISQIRLSTVEEQIHRGQYQVMISNPNNNNSVTAENSLFSTSCLEASKENIVDESSSASDCCPQRRSSDENNDCQEEDVVASADLFKSFSSSLNQEITGDSVEKVYDMTLDSLCEETIPIVEVSSSDVDLCGDSPTKDQETDTNDLFMIFRDNNSSKSSKWPNFKSFRNQFKLRRPSVANVARHLVSRVEKESNKNTYQSLGIQTSTDIGCLQANELISDNSEKDLTNAGSSNICTPLLNSTCSINMQAPLLTSTDSTNMQMPLISSSSSVNMQTPLLISTGSSNMQMPLLTSTGSTNVQTPLLTSVSSTNMQTPLLTEVFEPKQVKSESQKDILFSGSSIDAAFANVSKTNSHNMNSSSSGDAQKKKEAIVRPFSRTIRDEMQAVEPNEATMVQCSVDEVASNSSGITENKLIWISDVKKQTLMKPIMFCRSSERQIPYSDTDLVELCSRCFYKVKNALTRNSQKNFENENATPFDSSVFDGREGLKQASVVNSCEMYTIERPVTSRNQERKSLDTNCKWPAKPDLEIRCKSAPNPGEAEKLENLKIQGTPKFVQELTANSNPKLHLEDSEDYILFQGVEEQQQLDHSVLRAYVSFSSTADPKEIKIVGTRSCKDHSRRNEKVKQTFSQLKFEQPSEGKERSDDTLPSNLKKRRKFASSLIENCTFDDEFKTACEIINWHLDDLRRERDQNLRSAVMLVQERWFEIAGSKRSKSEVVRKYINYFREFSPNLLTFVINSGYPDGNTALHYAVANARFDVIYELLRIPSCDVNKSNKLGNTPIIISAACRPETQEDIKILKQLLARGNVNFRSLKMCQTALMMAAKFDNESVARLLLQNGADVNIQDNDGSTALMYAVQEGNLCVTKLLLEQPNCDYFIRDNDGFTALDIAINAHHVNIGMLVYLYINGDNSKLQRLLTPPCRTSAASRQLITSKRLSHYS